MWVKNGDFSKLDVILGLEFVCVKFKISHHRDTETQIRHRERQRKIDEAKSLREQNALKFVAPAQAETYRAGAPAAFVAN